MNNRFKNMSKRIIAFALTFLMITVYIPVVFAADNESVTIVLADPENDPPVASEVKVGQRLRFSKITGGSLMIQETGEILSDVEWFWNNESEIVNGPGMYTAIGISYSYLDYPIIMDVFVDIVGNVQETEITVLPIIPTLYYDGVTTLADIKLEGGVAVEKGTENIVEGTFNITNATGNILTDVILAKTYNLNVKFTPNDTEKYMPCISPVSFTVNKGTPSWKDGITPVVTVPYGTTVVAETFHNLRFDGTLVADENLRFDLCDAEGNFLHDGVFLNCGTYTDYQLRAASNSTQSNWQPALLPITIVVEPAEAEISVVYNSKTNQLNVSASSRYLYGTFDIYIDGKLAFDNAALENYINTMRFLASWLPDNITQNLTFDIKVVYNPAENDNAYIANDFEGTFTFEAERTINETEKSIYFYKGNASFTPGEDQLFAGEEIRVLAGMPDFLYWEITDSKGNDVELEFVKGDMNSKEITFVMPEFDINIDYVTQTDLDRQEAIEGCGCLCHNDNPIVQFFWRIILFFMNLFHIENVCDCGYPHGS